MSAPADFARCEGARRIDGRLIGVCIVCDRRSAPSGDSVVWVIPPIQRQRGGVWTCEQFRPTQQ